MTISSPAFNEAIERWKTLNDFGLHAENLSTLPAVRLKNLARYAGMDFQRPTAAYSRKYGHCSRSPGNRFGGLDWSLLLWTP
ncbi:hypothetical protein F6P94_23720 (plasmid) [Escherichia coli]|nr:hypothetical protein F6P94_23720 [Escherichia coli]